MYESIFWSILIHCILPILLVGLGILAIVLVILTLVYLVNVIKDWIKEFRD